MPQRFNLLLIQELARDKQEDIEALGTDWQSQLAEIPKMISSVKDWQEAVFDKFGEPQVRGHKRNQYKIVKPGELLALEDVSMDHTHFEGATIIQGLKLDLDGEHHARVTYKAVLMTDENHFLRKMLPKTVDIPVHDPAYDLLNVVIEVPRQELVRESLFALGEAIEGRHETMPVLTRRLRKLGRWASRHALALGLMGVMGLISAGAYALIRYVSSLPTAVPVPTVPTPVNPSVTVAPTVTTPDSLLTASSLFGLPTWEVLVFGGLLFIFVFHKIIRTSMDI